LGLLSASATLDPRELADTIARLVSLATGESQFRANGTPGRALPWAAHDRVGCRHFHWNLGAEQA
jgi:hypothetical protein